ncbi:MAG TPA: recombination protein NinB [Noviherbaspirillum sp.]|nr:recombination protein NinB [Noviherbaspirillum sp.]
MIAKRLFVLANDHARRNAAQFCMTAPDGWFIRGSEPTRTLDQNAKLWPMLDDISKQVVWYGEKLSKEEWKDVFTAGLKKSRVVPGIYGGFVICGQHTSTMPKRLFCELIELMYAFGAQRAPAVVWSDPQEVARLAAEARQYLDKAEARRAA